MFTMINKLGILLTGILLNSDVISANPMPGKEWHSNSADNANTMVEWHGKNPMPNGTLDSSTFGRILTYNSREAKPHSYPHQVTLTSDNKLFCSGSLITNQWVLTAAHCIHNDDHVKVVMGVHDESENEPSQVTMECSHFIIHKHYDSDTEAYDIGLIKLPSPVQFNRYINAARLGDSDLEPGTEVTATGWGRTSDDGRGSDVLREVTVPVISNEECQKVYGSYISINQICTDSRGGMGVCNGDSGGPLHYNGMIYGIASFISSEGCQSGDPHVFTNVPQYLNWINDAVGETLATKEEEPEEGFWSWLWSFLFG